MWGALGRGHVCGKVEEACGCRVQVYAGVLWEASLVSRMGAVIDDDDDDDDGSS